MISWPVHTKLCSHWVRGVHCMCSCAGTLQMVSNLPEELLVNIDKHNLIESLHYCLCFHYQNHHNRKIFAVYWFSGNVYFLYSINIDEDSLIQAIVCGKSNICAQYLAVKYSYASLTSLKIELVKLVISWSSWV